MDHTTDEGDLPPPPGVPVPATQILARLLTPEDPSPPGYEVVRRLGRGAMGDVYLARQLSLKRPVALKVIRADRLARTPAVRDRIRAEAEAVARLSHPHIVQIYEVGEDAGRPFLALEYLAGGSLDARLTAAPLAPDVAARLVADLAAGVQHAHDRGIIHRDLKPGNVLLDTDGTPKVGDFGLARVVGDLAAGDPAIVADSGPGLTQVGSVLGTPSYMAPEQAAGHTHLIGPRTDVYALGALLFECLTGRPPFKAPTPAETLELVLRLDPPSPRQFQPTVPRDLETVCLKCLRKDPDRRYQSAAELADDLGRFLRREPVAARPISRPERLVKWARRRPGPAVLAGLLTLAAVGLVVGGVVYEQQLRAARDAAQKESEEATRQKARAEANARRASDAVHRFLTRVGDERLKQVPEMEGIRAELLRDALEFYQGMLADADAPDPAVRFEAARALTRVGLIEQYLGRTDDAERHYRQAADRFAQLAADDPARTESSKEQAAAQSLASLLAKAAPDRAADAIDGARRRWKALLADAPDDPEYARSLAGCDHLDGLVHTNLGRPGPGEEAYRRALAARRVLADRFPADPTHRRDLGFTLHNLAVVSSQTGRPGPARESEAEAVRLFEAHLARDESDEEAMGALSAGLHNLGILLGPGETDAALRHQRRGLQLREELARRHPRVPTYQDAIGESTAGLVIALIGAGRPAEAVEPGRRGMEVLERLVRDHPTDLGYRWTLANLLANLSHPHAVAGRPADAARDLDRAVELFDGMVCEAPDRPLYWESLAGTCLAAGNLAGGTGRGRDALDWFARGVAAAEEALRIDPRLAQAQKFRLFCHGARAQTLAALNDHPAAVRDWDRVVELADDADRRTYRFMRLTAIGQAGDLPRLRAEADALLPGAAKEPDELIHIAGCYAQASANRDDLAATAVDLVRRAVEATPQAERAKRIADVHTQQQLKRLHARPDYQQLRAKYAK